MVGISGVFFWGGVEVNGSYFEDGRECEGKEGSRGGRRVWGRGGWEALSAGRS